MAAGSPVPDSPPPRMSQMAVMAKWIGLAALTFPALGFALSFVGEQACRLSFLLFMLTLPMVLTAVVFAFAAKVRIRRNPQLKGMEQAGSGFKAGTAGMVLLLVLILMSPAGTAPPCGRRVGGNEPSAVGSVRTINTSCVSYASSYPERGFPHTLGQLGSPAPGEKEGPEHAGMIDSVLASGRKSGYVFTYTPGAPDAKGTIASYTVSARPQEFNKTGRRSFFTDETFVIRFTEEDRVPTSQDPPLQ